MAGLWKKFLRGFLIGLWSMIVAGALQWTLWRWVGPSRFILLYPGVIVASVLGGWVAGLTATVVGVLEAIYFFFPPVHNLSIEEPLGIFPVLVFLGSSVAITVLNEILRKRQQQLRMVEAVRSAERERLALLDALDRERVRLEKALEARDEFLSIASHELKTPLTSLLLQIQVRQRRLRQSEADAFTPGKISKMLETDLRQIERLTRLVDDMLDVSRITSGRLTIAPEEVDLSALAREVVERYSEEAAKLGVEIRYSAEEPIVGTWDRHRLEQVLSNLLSNALKYGEKRPVAVTVARKDSSAEIRVRDQGKGIRKEDQARIFERFERGSAEKDVGGIGLGLYIVRKILDLHGGKVRVESEPGKGSTFIVDLPLRIALGAPSPLTRDGAPSGMPRSKPA